MSCSTIEIPDKEELTTPVNKDLKTLDSKELLKIAEEKEIKNMKMKMQTQYVIPDIVSTFPAHILKVTYPDDVIVDFGNFLTPTQVRDKPRIKWDAESGYYYAFFMTDPDAPSREEPKFREWQHWVVVNIRDGEINTGQTLTQYIGAAPPENTGYHRYVFLVFKQPKRLEFQETHLLSNSDKNRELFSTRKFVEKYNLEPDPVAGNFFLAQFDNYVPILYKRIHCC